MSNSDPLPSEPQWALESNTPAPPPAEARDEMPTGPLAPGSRAHRVYTTVKAFLAKHGKKIWWLHSFYALGLGTSVVIFAQKGLSQARWLSLGLAVAWIVMLLFFRYFGNGAAQDQATVGRGARIRFLVMTYVLKNIYQGMLFFLLPFYYQSATFDAQNQWFLVVLVLCAGLSTLDVVFDRVLMRWKILGSAFYAITLFSCLNLVVPTLLPTIRTATALSIAAGVTALAFFTLHVPLGALRRPLVQLSLALSMAASAGCAYHARRWVPPVPLHVLSAEVGPAVLADGRLALHVTALHESVINQLMAVTDITVPGGKGNRLVHVWRRDGAEIYRFGEDSSRVAGPDGVVRLRSTLRGSDLPLELAGDWTVEVETEDGQLVGRTEFVVLK